MIQRLPNHLDYILGASCHLVITESLESPPMLAEIVISPAIGSELALGIVDAPVYLNDEQIRVRGEVWYVSQHD